MSATVVDLEQARHRRWIAGAPRRRTLAALGLDPEGGAQISTTHRDHQRTQPLFWVADASQIDFATIPISRRTYEGAPMPDLTCPACGGPLPPRQRARQRVWCSDRCRKSRFSMVDPVTGRRRMETPEERRARRDRLAEMNARLRGVR